MKKFSEPREIVSQTHETRQQCFNFVRESLMDHAKKHNESCENSIDLKDFARDKKLFHTKVCTSLQTVTNFERINRLFRLIGQISKTSFI